MLLGRRGNTQFNVVNSPGTTIYAPFLSCMINLFVSKPRRRADRVAHRKLPTYTLGRSYEMQIGYQPDAEFFNRCIKTQKFNDLKILNLQPIKSAWL